MSFLFRLCAMAAALCAATPAMAGEPLDIVFFAPRGDVSAPSQITVQFSEPMRPLGVMEQDARTSPLQISAPGGTLPPGNYRWLDPSTLAYLFDSPLAGAWRLNALVKAGTSSLDGKKLSQDVSWEIATSPLKLDMFAPANVPPKSAQLALQSNYPLSLEAVREKLSLSTTQGPVDFLIEQNRSYSDVAYLLADSPANNDNYRFFTITPQGIMPPDDTLSVTMAAGLKGGNGNMPAEASTWSYPTYSSLALNRWEVFPARFNEAQKRAMPESSLVLNFNNPVFSRDLAAHLEISPPVSLFANASTDEFASSWQNFPYEWKSGTTYTVTVKKGLQDEYGTSLAEDITFSFSVGDYSSVFYADRGWRILERARGGEYPIALRNIGPVRTRLTYRPWEGALTEERFRRLLSSDDFEKALYNTDDPQTLSRDLLLDYSTDRNRSIRHILNLPEVLNVKNANSLAGPVDVRFSYRYGNTAYGEKPRDAHLRTLLQVTDLAVTAKTGHADGLAWVTSIASGKPVSGAALTLFSQSGKELWTGKTDAQGLAVLPGRQAQKEAPALLAARTATDVSLLPLGEAGFSPNTIDYLPFASQSDQERWTIHAVSQLPLYQPGQTVNFILYAKRFTDQNGKEALPAPDWRPLAGKTLAVSIMDNRGKTVHAMEAQTNAFGSLEGSFTLPDTATLGMYRISARSTDLTHTANTSAFQVASFRPPDFVVKVDGPQSHPNDTLNPVWPVALAAAYFSGAPMPGAKADLTVMSAETSFTPPRLKGYKTGLNSGPALPWRGYYHGPRSASETIHEAQGVLDNTGEVRFNLKAPLAAPGKTLEITMQGEVTDESGLVTQGNGEFLLHPSSWYVGLKAPWFIPANMEAPLELKAATWDNQPVDSAQLTITALRLLPNLSETNASDDEMPEEKTETAWEKTVTLQERTGTKLGIRFEKSGTYRLEVAITDPEGRRNVSSTTIIVPGPGSEWIRLRDASHLELTPDEDSYQAGSTARLMFNNPFADQGECQALVTTERNGILSRRLETVSGEMPVIEIPLTPKDAPYVYASITLVTGRTAPPPALDGEAGALDLGSPKSAFGSALLKVEAQKPVLEVSVDTDSAHYRPGGKVAVRARALLGREKAAGIQVTLLAVDERILTAANDDSPYYPAKTFTPLYSHGIRTADSRQMLLNLNMPQWKQTEKNFMRSMAPMQAAPEAMQDAMIMSAGGGAGPEVTIRQNFSPLAFWLGQGVTDSNGEITAEFQLPDTLTSYRIIAVVADQKSTFATGETSVTVNQPLQILSALPRFATEGDKLEGRILVQNTGSVAGRVTVQAESSGVRLQAESAQTDLAPGTSKVLTFPMEFDSPGMARLLFSAAIETPDGTEEDRVEISLPVKAAMPLTTVAAAGLLHQGTTFNLPVAVPTPLDKRSRMEVTLAPSPVAGSLAGLNAVLDYPWQCLEQQLSKAWVRSIRLRHGTMLGLQADPEDEAVIRAVMANATAFQLPDGGFALWQGMSRSDYYLTAYALLVNSQTAQAGFALDPETADAAAMFLLRMLEERIEYQDAGKGSLVPDALILYLLADEHPEFSRKTLDIMIKWAEKDPNRGTPMFWGCLLLAVQKIPDLPDREALGKRLLVNLEKCAVRTPVQLHFAGAQQAPDWFSMGSTLRDNAMVLAALAQIRPDYPRLEGLAHWVGQGLGSRAILSTQEGTYGLWALATYLESLGGDRPVRVSSAWRDNAVTETFRQLADVPRTRTFDAASLAPPPGQATNQELLNLEALEGNPYWTARLAYASPSLPPQAESAGFSVTHEWLTPGPWQVGDVVEVRLNIIVPAIRRQVLLFDPFPAGLEPLYATRADLQEGDKKYSAPWNRQETREDGLLLYAETVTPGSYSYTYKLRAAAPGVFTRRATAIEEMYTPEVFGRTAGEVVMVGGE